MLAKQFETDKVLVKLAGDVSNVPVIPTGLATLDYDVLGCGGLPRGRIIEIFGPESSGKTALCSHVIGCVQASGGLAAMIDAEHAFEPSFAENAGRVNIDELVVSQPSCGEEALETVEALVDAKAVDLIVVDSVSMLVPRAELAGEMGDSHMGLQARLMSQACRKLVGKTAKNGVTVIFINQIRSKIGVVFGNPEVTSGGNALKFAASVRLETRREAMSKGGVIKDAAEAAIGHRMSVKAVKNKVGPPFNKAHVDLYYATGFDKRESALEHAEKIGVIEGKAWMTISGDKTEEKYRRADLPLDKIQEMIKNYHEVKQNG